MTAIPRILLAWAIKDRLFAHQEGLCGICHDHMPGTRARLDHDHDSGLIRGLLCPSCNVHEASWWSRYDDQCLAYRANPPASQLGLTVLYSDAIRLRLDRRSINDIIGINEQ